MKKTKNKILNFSRKGEMTTEQIVVMIVAIASFAVILYFLAALGMGENTEDELCRNSVAQRASMDKVPGADIESIPLNCKRSYVCLTEDGSCEDMYKPEIMKVKTENDVYEVLADELADCWWMFGEGKINYVGEDLFGDLHCSLCSQIAFDDSVKEIFPSGEFSENKFYESLKKMNKTNDKTYFEYLFITSDSEEFFKQDFGNIKLDSQYYTLIGITSDVSEWGWIAGVGIGAAVVVGAIAFAPLAVIGLGTSAGIVGSLVSAGAAGTVGAVGTNYVIAPIVKGWSGNDFISPTLIEVNSEEFKKIKCEEITTGN